MIMTTLLTTVLLKVPFFIIAVGMGALLFFVCVFIFTSDKATHNSCLLAKLIKVASIIGLIASIAIAVEVDDELRVGIILMGICNVLFGFGFAIIVDAAHKYLNKDA